MKIALAQIEVKPGQPNKNLARILEEIQKARENKSDVLVFSEMVVGGYLLGDEWENKSLVNELMRCNETIKEASENIAVIWGNVYVDKNKKGEDGRWRKYNSVFIAQDKKWVNNGIFEGRSYKTLLPKYREFDDERHFYSLIKEAKDSGLTVEQALQPFEVEINNKKHKLGLMLCEDMWSDDYSTNPSKILVQNGAEILVNISCSPWTARKNDKRHRVIKGLLSELKVPFLYCNNVGVQNNGKNIFLFDGNTSVYDKNGNIVVQAGDYKEETVIFDTENAWIPGQARNDIKPTEESDLEDLYKGLVYGVSKFFEPLSSKKVVIGLSGGIDSAVVASVLVEALGPENVFGVNMPSMFNSELTKNAAKKLAENLKIDYKVVPIQEAVEITVKQLREIGLEPSSSVIENIQARDRSSRVLAAIAGTLNAVFVNNGNKTETALGYCTLYGDVDGAIAPIADLYKGQVYALAEYINKTNNKEVIPEEIIKVVPSAELSAEQDVTKGKGDPMDYPYHDKLIRAFVEWRLDPTEILEKYDTKTITADLGLEKNIDQYFSTRESFVADLEHKWRLYKINIFKRIQAPPIIATSRRAFGFDLREAQNGFYFTSEFLASANNK